MAKVKTRAPGLLEKVAEFYHKTLTDTPEALKFLDKHKLQSSVEMFRLGYCSGKLCQILPDDERVRDELSGLGIMDDGAELLINCLTFPVNDALGSIRGIIGVNISDGSLAIAGERPLIWNEQAFEKYKTVLVTDDVISALCLYGAEYVNVAAILPDDINDASGLLTRYTDVKVHLAIAFDNSKKYTSIFKHAGIKASVVPLTDPVTRIHAHGGADELRNAIESAISSTGESLLEELTNGFAVNISNRHYEVRGINKTDRMLKASIRIEYRGKLHVDTVDLYKAKDRNRISQDLGMFLDEPAVHIDSDVSKLIKLCEEYRPTAEKQAAVIMTEDEKTEALALGKSDDMINAILRDYELCGLVGEKHNKLLCYIAAVSRKMIDPLSILILSSSGAGKSALQDATLFFVPPEDVVKLTSITGKALFYKGEKSLKHKLLAIEEETGAEEAVYAIRNLISAKELVIEVTVKDYTTGKMTTMENRVEGPTAVFITTTNPETDPETRSRFFVTNVDESREQTRRILEFQRKVQTLEYQVKRAELLPVAKKHWNYQRMLKPMLVVNPFAEKMSFVDDRLQGRRDQPKYLSLIRAVAFMRQLQKKIRKHDGKDFIEVDKTDMAIANELVQWLIGRSLDDLNGISRDLLFQVDRMLDERLLRLGKEDSKEKLPDKYSVQFTRREIREYSGWAQTRVRRYIDQLVEMEYLHAESGRFGAAYKYRLICDVINLVTPGHHLASTWSAPGHHGKPTKVIGNKEDRRNLAKTTGESIYEENIQAVQKQ